jgi:hypothetical protein
VSRAAGLAAILAAAALADGPSSGLSLGRKQGSGKGAERAKRSPALVVKMIARAEAKRARKAEKRRGAA